MTNKNETPPSEELPKLPDASERIGRVAHPDMLRQILGDEWVSKLHPDVFNYLPQGHRLLVALDEVPQALDSGIVLPETTREMTQIQVGWGVVISAGPFVGQPVPHPGGLNVLPHEILCSHVSFPSHVGSFIQMGFTKSDQYPIPIAMITDRDIWNIDLKPPSEWFKLE